LWDWAAEDPMANSIALPIPPTLDTIRNVSFSHDGQLSHWLITDSNRDNRHIVCLWNMRLDELMKLACRTARRNLTEKEWQQYFYGQPYQKTCPELP
jgi:hypothetical protein